MSSIGAVGVGVRSRVMLDDTDDDVDEYVDQDVQNCANDFIERNGFYTPGKLQMDTSEGNKTIMYVTSYRPDIGLNEEIFSKSFLVKY